MKTTLTRNERIVSSALRIAIGIVAGIAAIITLIIFLPRILWELAVKHKEMLLDTVVVIMLAVIFVTGIIVLPLVLDQP